MLSKFALAISLLVAAQQANAQSDYTVVQWGSNNPLLGSYYTLGDSSDTLFNATTNTAFLGLGYFTDPSVGTYASDISSVYSNFVLLASSGVSGPGADGFEGALSNSSNIYTDMEPGSSAVGMPLYVFVLPGVSEYTEAQVLAVAEYAIYTDSSWGIMPLGSGGTGTLDDNWTNTIDTVLWGTLVPDGGVGAGSSKILTGAVVPEPSTYSALFGLATLLVLQLRRRRQA